VVTRKCRLRRLWTRSLGGQLNAIPTVVNNTVVVATGTGQLRVYAAASGRLVVRRDLRGAAFVAPIAVGRDVAVVTWSRKLMVYRLR
jgi:outer membrane protein assembly factor BamB